jgi:hypothetical protein
MIGKYLANKNENAMVPKIKKISELNKAKSTIKVLKLQCAMIGVPNMQFRMFCRIQTREHRRRAP